MSSCVSDLLRRSVISHAPKSSFSSRVAHSAQLHAKSSFSSAFATSSVLYSGKDVVLGIINCSSLNLIDLDDFVEIFGRFSSCFSGFWFC